MKKLLITIAILIPLILVGQEQNSILQKGLVFHWPGSEWHNQPTGSADIISGKLGTSTDVQNVMGRGGSGNRWYEFDGVNDYVTLPTIAPFGTGDFSVVMKININSLADYRTLLSGLDNSFGIRVNPTGYLCTTLTGIDDNTPSAVSVTINTEYVITYIRTSGIGNYYINGVFAGATTDIRNYSVKNSLIGTYASLRYFSGSISMTRIFNYALTPTQITNYSDPAYPIEAVDRSGANLLDLNPSGMTSTEWNDLTNATTATVTGASLTIPANSNLGASSFNGTSSNTAFTSHQSIENIFDNGGTVSIWILKNGSTEQLAISKLKWYIDKYLTQQIAFYQEFTSGYVYVIGSTVLTNGQWYHVVINYDNSLISNIPEIYINGVKETLSVTTITATGTRVSDSGLNLSLGNHNGGFFFLGNLSDARLYNRILPPSEITLLYRRGPQN